MLLTRHFLSLQLHVHSPTAADLLTGLSGGIIRTFNRSGATRAVALDISKAFYKVWHAESSQT